MAQILCSSSSCNLIVKKLFFNSTKPRIIASLLRDENVIALVEGSEDKISTCALSTVTGIPLIRLHDNKVSDQCEKVIQMSAGYKDIATATLALINMFHWESIAVLFDGKQNFCRSR